MPFDMSGHGPVRKAGTSKRSMLGIAAVMAATPFTYIFGLQAWVMGWGWWSLVWAVGSNLVIFGYCLMPILWHKR